MIRVKRLDCPNILKIGITPESSGEWETKDAIAYFQDVINHQEKYKRTGASGARIKQSYNVYSDKSVRKTLLKMFHGKCAYCESKITSIYNGDIEHFRPKGKVNEANPQKPGYFWLASEWTNLLFACPFCNQTNTHEFNNAGVIDEAVFGKLDQFPLIRETNRLNHTHGLIYLSDYLTYKQSFDLEELDRLLINPCVDSNIDTYFKYDDDGAIIINDGLNALETIKALTSIKVYALHRFTLSTARREKITQIKAQIKRVENAIINFNNFMNNSYEDRIWFEGIMREEMEILKKYKQPDQEYAGLARYIINKYFDDAAFVI